MESIDILRYLLEFSIVVLNVCNKSKGVNPFLSLCFNNFDNTGVLKFKIILPKVKLKEKIAKCKIFQ